MRKARRIIMSNQDSSRVEGSLPLPISIFDLFKLLKYFNEEVDECRFDSPQEYESELETEALRMDVLLEFLDIFKVLVDYHHPEILDSGDTRLPLELQVQLAGRKNEIGLSVEYRGTRYWAVVINYDYGTKIYRDAFELSWLLIRWDKINWTGYPVPEYSVGQEREEMLRWMKP